jgi:putative hydrolase
MLARIGVPAKNHRRRTGTFGSVDPVVALRRIAYLLETELAETYKVRAFRRAAATLAEESPARIEELARSRRLTSLPGIG